MYKKYLITSFSVFYFCICIISGQEGKWTDRLYAEANVHYGFIMPHHTFIYYCLEDHIRGFQFNIGLHTNGEKLWQQQYNYPGIGIGFYHSNLGNDDIFGKINALFFYVDRYYFKVNKRFNLGNRISFGMSHITKKYDLQTNHFDYAIGTKFNVYLNYSLEFLYQFTPKSQFKLGFGLSHTSNGHFRDPNKGLNIATSLFGYTYSFKNPVYPVVPKDIETEGQNKNQVIFSGIYGMKEISLRYNDMYYVTAFSTEYERKIFRNFWIGGALTFYYDPSVKKEIEIDYGPTSESDKIRYTFNLSYELRMGRLSYILQPGIYIRNKYPKAGRISNRIGIRYQVSNRIIASVAIKAHWFAIADFTEWSAGYKLFK